MSSRADVECTQWKLSGGALNGFVNEVNPCGEVSDER